MNVVEVVDKNLGYIQLQPIRSMEDVPIYGTTKELIYRIEPLLWLTFVCKPITVVLNDEVEFTY